MPYEVVAGLPPNTIDLADEILDATSAAIFALDRAGRVVHWNRATARLTGISADEIRGKNPEQSIIFADDIDRWKLKTARAFNALFSRCVEIRWNCQGGSIHPLACSLSRADAGDVEYLACRAAPGYTGQFPADCALELHHTFSMSSVATEGL